MIKSKANVDKRLALFTGLMLSIVSAWYAITGLAAIFSAAFWSVIIMGTALEIGKIITASYLYRNWKVLPFMMKSYFTVAVAILMFITSMGVFGYLSKAHIEQSASSGDVQSKIQMIDSRIERERDRVTRSETALKQLDLAINKIIEVNDATQGLRLRRSQEKERTTIKEEVKDAQKTIDNLQSERIPLSQQIREVEKEVGPIRYVAELLYGESTKEVLERSVRLMIIALVLVLDPLALLLIISSNVNYNNNIKTKSTNDKYVRDARNWFRSNANAVETDGKNWTEMPGVTITKK